MFPKIQKNACLIQLKFELYEFPHNHVVIKAIALLLEVFFRTRNIERNSQQIIMFWFHSLSHLQSRVNEARDWDWQWMNVKSSDANILLIIYFIKFISTEYKGRIFHNTTGQDMKGVTATPHLVIKSRHLSAGTNEHREQCQTAQSCSGCN
jgi:hypothetical protein